MIDITLEGSQRMFNIVPELRHSEMTLVENYIDPVLIGPSRYATKLSGCGTGNGYGRLIKSDH